MGDATEYLTEQGNGMVSNGVVVVKSLQWPGSASFYQNGRFQQIYVGSGHKYEQNVTFYPVDPPLLESDPQEYEGPEEPSQMAPVVEAEPEQKEEGEADEEAE